MSFAVQTGAINYSSDAERQALLEGLRKTYPELDVSHYNALAEDDMKISSEVERYVMGWFLNLFYPSYYEAHYSEVKTPEEEAALAKIETDFQAFFGDHLWLIADKNVVPMPDELREAFVQELQQATGTKPPSSTDPTNKDSGANGNDPQTDGTLNPDLFQGFTHTEDIDSVLRYFPPNSLAGQMFGFLGENALLGRNIQAKSSLALAEINEMEREIMEELGGLNNLSPDDPRYQTRMKQLQLQVDDLRSSKEMYSNFIVQSQQSVQQLTELFSNFIKEFNENQKQLASNLRIA